jgi:hypothetical protein
MASDLVPPNVEQCCIIKFPVKEKVKPAEMHSLERGPCHVPATVIGTVNFLKAIKNFRTCYMLTLSQQLYVRWSFAVWKQVNSSVWHCIQRGHKCFKCWKNYLQTLTVQERVCLVGPKDINAQLECAACCCACWTCAPVLIIGKHFPKAYSDLWQDLGALFNSGVQVVQNGVASQGISITQQSEDTAVSWQHHDKRVSGFGRNYSCWFFLHMV